MPSDGSQEHDPGAVVRDIPAATRPAGRPLLAICGDVMHSRVAPAHISCYSTPWAARVRVGPLHLLPRGIERMGVELAREQCAKASTRGYFDILRLQREAHERLVSCPPTQE